MGLKSVLLASLLAFSFGTRGAEGGDIPRSASDLYSSNGENYVVNSISSCIPEAELREGILCDDDCFLEEEFDDLVRMINNYDAQICEKGLETATYELYRGTRHLEMEYLRDISENHGGYSPEELKEKVDLAFSFVVKKMDEVYHNSSPDLYLRCTRDDATLRYLEIGNK
ncbi:MAG: hypothetical protein AABX11_01815 [Nanoarchaeota archaeon]